MVGAANAGTWRGSTRRVRISWTRRGRSWLARLGRWGTGRSSLASSTSAVHNLIETVRGVLSLELCLGGTVGDQARGLCVVQTQKKRMEKWVAMLGFHFCMIVIFVNTVLFVFNGGFGGFLFYGSRTERPQWICVGVEEFILSRKIYKLTHLTRTFLTHWFWGSNN